MLQNLGLFLLLLGILIFVHELGHFLVAKACGVKVLRFSIGFGSKLVGFKRGETEYWISWLPFGGYVKMAGENPYEEVAPEDRGRGFLTQPPWKRALIVLAGPAFNIIFPILIYFPFMLGAQRLPGNVVRYLEAGMPAAEAGIKVGDRILAVDGQSVESFADVQKAIRSHANAPLTFTLERDGKRQDVKVEPVRATSLDGVETTSHGMVGLAAASPPALLGVPPGSPAEQAGLKTFDRLLSVNGQAVKQEGAMERVLSQASGTLELKVSRFSPANLPGVPAQLPEVRTIRMEKQPGTGYAALGAERADLYVYQVLPNSPASQAGIKAGDRLMAIDGKPLVSSSLLYKVTLPALREAPFTLTWRSGTETHSKEVRQMSLEPADEYSNPVAVVGLGVLSLEAQLEEDPADAIIVTFGPGRALVAAVDRTYDRARQIAVSLGSLFVGKVPLKTLGGPVAIYQGVAMTSELGSTFYWQLMAMISLNLGLFNLIPIPILDGFHLLAALWEGIRRRPIPLRAREIANMVGLAMLLLLMGLAFRNDLVRLFS